MKQVCQETFEKGVFTDIVRDTTFITKSNSARQSIFEYDRRHNCAKDYAAIAQELIKTVESRKNSEIVSRRMNSQTNETNTRNIGVKG